MHQKAYDIECLLSLEAVDLVSAGFTETGLKELPEVSELLFTECALFDHNLLKIFFDLDGNKNIPLAFAFLTDSCCMLFPSLSVSAILIFIEVIMYCFPLIFRISC